MGGSSCARSSQCCMGVLCCAACQAIVGTGPGHDAGAEPGSQFQPAQRLVLSPWQKNAQSRGAEGGSYMSEGGRGKLIIQLDEIHRDASEAVWSGRSRGRKVLLRRRRPNALAHRHPSRSPQEHTGCARLARAKNLPVRSARRRRPAAIVLVEGGLPSLRKRRAAAPPARPTASVQPQANRAAAATLGTSRPYTQRQE